MATIKYEFVSMHVLFTHWNRFLYILNNCQAKSRNFNKKIKNKKSIAKPHLLETHTFTKENFKNLILVFSCGFVCLDDANNFKVHLNIYK